MRENDIRRKGKIAEIRRKHTLDEKAIENEKQRKRMRALRDNRSKEKEKEAREKNTNIKRRSRTVVEYMEGLKSNEILKGVYKVFDIENTQDSIGKMDTICKFCRALQFKRETSSSCCNNGKVILEGFPKPPDPLNNLWFADTVEGRLFRENSRSLNNAVCLTSIKVRTKDFGKGFSPNIIFEGKATQLAGPLKACDGERPYFAIIFA